MMRGAERHKRRLQRLASPQALEFVGQALYAGGQLIENYAAKSITNGAVSGKAHIASKPGEPPNADTGVLDGGIETVQHSNILTEVSSNAQHAKIEFGFKKKAGVTSRSFAKKDKQGPVRVEFGDSKTEARPYMAPARDAMRPKVEKLFTKALSKAVKMSGA